MTVHKLLRHAVEHEREEIHLWSDGQRAACGKEFNTISGVWYDDDRKVTCPDCQVIRDGTSRVPLPHSA